METKNRLFGNALLEELNRQLERRNEIDKDREDRINRGETDYEDCFRSIEAGNGARAEIEAKISIIKGGGVSDFDCYHDATTGEKVKAVWIENQYGASLMMCYADNSKKFVPIFKRTGRTATRVYKAHGFKHYDDIPEDRKTELYREARKAYFLEKGFIAGTETLPVWCKMKGMKNGVGTYTEYFPSNFNYATGEEFEK